MAVKIQSVPYSNLLSELVVRAQTSLLISSPFITADACRYIYESKVPPRIITKVTAANLSTKALDSQVLMQMLERGAEIRSIPNLHAKIYLVNGKEGIVTSSNLTGPGFFRNVE